MTAAHDAAIVAAARVKFGQDGPNGTWDDAPAETRALILLEVQDLAVAAADAALAADPPLKRKVVNGLTAATMIGAGILGLSAVLWVAGTLLRAVF